MQAKVWSLVVTALLACGSLVVAPAVSADPVPYVDFVAARGAAVAGSGVFTPGTTMVIDVTAGSGATLHIAVNPDGSLTWVEQGSQGLFRMKCVRVERCWEQSDAEFDDTRWHLLPPDSVTYRQAAAGWQRVLDLGWPTTTQVEIGTAIDGAPTFAASATEDGVTLTEVVTVRPMRLTEVLTMTSDDGEMLLREVSMAAQEQPIVVVPPARRAVGIPAAWLSAWTADINS